MKKLTLLLILTLLSACNPKKNSVRSNTAVISGVEVGAQCNSTNMTSLSSSQYGTIYDGTASSYDFENRVKSLLSVTLQPSEIGNVSGGQADPTGVRFSGRIKLDGNGNVVSAQSKVLISIYDSIWLMNKYSNPSEQEIRISFDPNIEAGSSISGQFNTDTGVGYFILRDTYGEIRFEGTIDAQRLSGVVSFQNTTNVAGGSPASGVLGQFYIQRCAFLQ